MCASHNLPSLKPRALQVNFPPLDCCNTSKHRHYPPWGKNVGFDVGVAQPWQQFNFSCWMTLSIKSSQLEHITDKTGYPLTLNFFYFINRYRGVALDSTCMFGTLFWEILVIARLFFLAKNCKKDNAFEIYSLFFWKCNWFYMSQSGLKETGQVEASLLFLFCKRDAH